MTPRYVHTVRLIVGLVALVGSILAQIVDAPAWVGVLAGTLAAGLALVTRVEAVLGEDLDGDGHVGPRRPRLPLWLAIAGAGLLSARCGGAPAVDVGEPAGYLGSTGYAALTLAHGEVSGEVDGEIQADVSVPVCLDVGGGLCLSVRVYGLATGGSDLPEGAEVCAEIRAWGRALAVRCVSSMTPEGSGMPPWSAP